MPKLELFIIDGGVDSFESEPIQEDGARNSSMPKDKNSSFLNNALLLLAGKTIIDAGVSQIGFVTGDYRLERQVKNIITGAGFIAGLSVNAPATLFTTAVKIGTDVFTINRVSQRKQHESNENQKRTGVIAVNGSIYGGAK